jgi:dTDP-4-dehydrorhamnose 3,5-epimerase
MKSTEPILLKDVFGIFTDKRGFLNAADLTKIIHQVGNQKFDIRYQLMSFSQAKATFRGFHYQDSPYAQNKLILLHQGSISDFIVPVESPKINDVLTYEMSAGDALFVPDTFAHGFLTKTKNVIMQYIMDDVFVESHYKGINGENFLRTIVDFEKVTVSEKDAAFLKSVN